MAAGKPASPASIPIGVVDLPAVIDFLHRVAVLRAISESTQAEWQSYKDSKALNVLYGVFGMVGKVGPGAMTVTTASPQMVRERASQIFLDSFKSFLRALEQGPEMLAKFMLGREKVRANDAERLESLFREVAQVNKMVDGQLASAARTFAAVQLAGTVSIALLSGGIALQVVAAQLAGTSLVVSELSLFSLAVGHGKAASIFLGAIPTGYGVATSLIKDWDSMSTARLLAFVGMKEVAKKGTEAGLSSTAQTTVVNAALDMELHGKALKDSRKALDVQRTRMARKIRTSPTAARKLAERRARVEAAERGVQGAVRSGVGGRLLGHSIPVVFAAWDIFEGIKDFNEVVDATR